MSGIRHCRVDHTSVPLPPAAPSTQVDGYNGDITFLPASRPAGNL
jgi:hypothetical protein